MVSLTVLTKVIRPRAARPSLCRNHPFGSLGSPSARAPRVHRFAVITRLAAWVRERSRRVLAPRPKHPHQRAAVLQRFDEVEGGNVHSFTQVEAMRAMALHTGVENHTLAGLTPRIVLDPFQ